MKYIKHILYLALLLITLTNCIEREIIINKNNSLNNKDSLNNNIDDSSIYTVFFSAYIESEVARSMSDFPSDRTVKMYIFNSNGSYYSSKIYKTETEGTLTSQTSNLVLPSGEYDFYAVSANNSNSPPSFSNNVFTSLQNGTDYLWCGNLNNQIITNDVTIPITFNHCCAQIVVEISTSSNAPEIDSLLYATIQQPSITSNMNWNIKDGIITPATSLNDSLIEMSTSNMTCSQILLPLTGIDELLMTFAVLQNNDDEDDDDDDEEEDDDDDEEDDDDDDEEEELYKLYIPLPDGELLAGYSYYCTVEVTDSEIEIYSVTVTPWNIIDEEGNPLYPQLK